MKFKKFVSSTGDTLIFYRIDKETNERVDIDYNGGVNFYNDALEPDDTIDATPLEFAEFYDRALQKILEI